MGWSCRADAGMVMDRWHKFCVDSTGMSNVYKDRNNTYMIEYSHKEHSDGRITGKIFLMIGNLCYPKRQFCISPDGQKVTGPKCLAAFALKTGEHAPHYGIGSNP